MHRDVTCTIIWDQRRRGRLSAAAANLAPRHTVIGSRGAHGTAPSTQLLPTPLRSTCVVTRGRHARTRAGVRVGGPHAGSGGRTRGGTARPPRRAEGGGRAGGRRRAVPRARVELSLILGWLTACLPRTPVHICGNESILPPMAASRLEGGSTSGCGDGAWRARSVEVDTWDRGTAGLSSGYDERLGPSRQPRFVPSQSRLSAHKRGSTGVRISGGDRRLDYCHPKNI